MVTAYPLTPAMELNVATLFVAAQVGVADKPEVRAKPTLREVLGQSADTSRNTACTRVGVGSFEGHYVKPHQDALVIERLGGTGHTSSSASNSYEREDRTRAELQSEDAFPYSDICSGRSRGSPNASTTWRGALLVIRRHRRWRRAPRGANAPVESSADSRATRPASRSGATSRTGQREMFSGGIEKT